MTTNCTDCQTNTQTMGEILFVWVRVWQCSVYSEYNHTFWYLLCISKSFNGSQMLESENLMFQQMDLATTEESDHRQYKMLVRSFYLKICSARLILSKLVEYGKPLKYNTLCALSGGNICWDLAILLKGFQTVLSYRCLFVGIWQ